MTKLNESYFLTTNCGLGVMFLVIGFFHILHRIIGYCCIPIFIKSKGKETVWKWCNLLMSWFHALIVGSWDLLCFYYYPELMEDLVDFKNTFCYYLIVFSTGYFLYDFGDMFYNNKILKMWELTLHHIAVISTFLYNLLSVRFVGYNVVALLCEVSSFFLHSRKLLQLANVPFHNFGYRCVTVINLIAFAFFRGTALCKITYGMYAERRLADRIYFSCLCFSMGIMNLLNSILFWIILKNDFLRQYKKPKLIVANGKTMTNGLHIANGQIHSSDLQSKDVSYLQKIDEDKSK